MHQMSEIFHNVAEFTYGTAQRDRFREGSLHKEWADRYPMLFDEQDVESANNQASGGYHFVEWLTSILLFETFGYLSLVEKYQYTYHPKKYKIFSKIAPPSVLEFIDERAKTDKTQGPDLFVYSPDESQWFFCEVKGPKDKFRESQISYFNELYRVTGKSIGTVQLVEAESAL